MPLLLSAGDDRRPIVYAHSTFDGIIDRVTPGLSVTRTFLSWQQSIPPNFEFNQMIDEAID
jgi:hypothetical protein